MKFVALALILAVAVSLFSAMSVVHAQQTGGGVQIPGEWWLGEGLKQGDYFSYRLCHANYYGCTDFEVDFWIQGDKQVGSESKWLAQAVVYEGDKVYRGELEFDKNAAKLSGSTDNLERYRDAIQYSISWLSAFATSHEGDKGPKAFSSTSWGKLADFSGYQVAPRAVESVTVPAGTFDAVEIGWRDCAGPISIWVVDEFPFPVKAVNFNCAVILEGSLGYEFHLLDYKENVQTNPFADIEGDRPDPIPSSCPDNDQLPFSSLKKPTVNFNYVIKEIHEQGSETIIELEKEVNFNYGLEVFYKPEEPKQGCEIDWIINFKDVHDEAEFLNNIHYDIMVVDEDMAVVRSLAYEENKNFLYSPSGKDERTMVVKEPVGQNRYLIIVYGLSPEFVLSGSIKTATDYLLVPITVKANDDPAPFLLAEQTENKTDIPDGIRNNAGLWASDMIDDATFAVSLQYMIQEGIIVVPDVQGGSGSGDSQIPGWFKDNAGLWASGMIDDATFAVGIQHLIENGIIHIETE